MLLVLGDCGGRTILVSFGKGSSGGQGKVIVKFFGGGERE